MVDAAALLHATKLLICRVASRAYAAPASPKVGAGNMRISVRRAGYLMKKKFSSGGKGKWQRRWFVLKDAFLLYYKEAAGNKPGAQYTWNNKPLGCIPLGNTAVQRVKGRNSDGSESNRAWEIVHKDFHGGALLLAADDEAEATAWIRLLEQNRTVTHVLVRERDTDRILFSRVTSVPIP